MQSTQHWVTGGIQLRRTFVVAIGGELSFLSSLEKEGGALNSARQVLIFISGWTLDFVLVYRVYVLFGQSYIIPAIPGLCLIGTMGTSCILLSLAHMLIIV